MKANENLVIIGEKVILVPYRPEHVPKYHEWMQSSFLQEMTASEPLTIDQEYEMQKSWHMDENKMVGDINLFFNDHDSSSIAEIEIMIAEKTHYRSGLATNSLFLMFNYAINNLKISKFTAKISVKNHASITLFTKKFNFIQTNYSEVFQEISLELCITDYVKNFIKENVGNGGYLKTGNTEESTKKAEKTFRKFWKEVSILSNKDVYQIALDKRPLKTPGGSPLVIPRSQKYLAVLIAGEWESQKAVLKQHSLPLTSLVSRSIDTFEKDPSSKKEAITRLIRYFDTDTVCYQETYPDILVDLQKQYWDPTVKWAQETYDIEIKVTNDIIVAKQPVETKNKLRTIIEEFDCLKLSAFERATMLTKSFLIGLGLVERQLTVEFASKAAQVETISQTTRWGNLEDAHEIDNEYIRHQLGSVVCALIVDNTDTSNKLDRL
ncbi:ATP12-domain-containing protein [Gigaspora margarita]|uniref:ATP12-domain-containing protein n=1 Tax=Gigaspora margarita TaxID=4874 RepID=A0A8H3XIL8_GIGMA|nr:ATP12-domain-containing protein [Gigaspora margarita]